jgi:acyl carrier protein
MQNMTDRLGEVEAWMVAYLADLLDIPPTQVDVRKPFEQFGLDSTATVAFTSDLGRWLGIKLDTQVMIENDDIQSVARHIRTTYGKAAGA